MRTFIKRAIEARKSQRENGEAGFSLVELIVVVVILGILAAVAIPIFLGLQGQAEQSAQDTVAANAASQAAATFANGGTITESTSTTDPSSDFDNLADSDGTNNKYTIAITKGVNAAAADPLGVDNFCITVTSTTADESTAGPGC